MKPASSTDPALRSWVPGADGSDFPVQNLPLGAFVSEGGAPRLGVAIGDSILDLQAVARLGLFDGVFPDARALLSGETLNAFLAAGRPAWSAFRGRLSTLLQAGDGTLRDAHVAEKVLVPQSAVRMALPLTVGDFVDFYSSLEHATNLGAILRPGSEPLLPNWRFLPVGYHGRSATVVASGTPIVRPCGQLKIGDGAPVFAPTRALDFELELAFVTAGGPETAAGIAPDRARDYIYGVALLNDWSARDIQAWEYQPLGPFLAKSFATSLGPWIVSLDALEPYRVAGPEQDPPALPHLATSGPEAYDIPLEVALVSNAMRERGLAERVVTRTNFRAMYWSMAQQLAHASSNGARVRAGDLFGSGTISGSEPSAYGSLIELTWRGARPLELPDGTQRRFLEDGDAVVMRARSVRDGAVPIGFGECRGAIVPAL